jgi:hypothetical protein
LSEPDIPSLEDFKSHFETNYREKVESYLKWSNRRRRSQTLANVLLWGLIAFWVSAILLGTAGYGIGEDAFVYATFCIMASVAGALTFSIASNYKRRSLKVERKNVLVYHLLEASKCYEAFVNEAAKHEFLDKCVSHLEEFGASLRGILDNSMMPLRLPDINQLEALQDNIMNRIYPAVRQGKNYPSAENGKDFQELFSSLARFFFFEKEYDEMPLINEEVSKQLSGIYETYVPPIGYYKSFVGKIGGSFRLFAVLSLPVFIMSALGLIYVLRLPQYGIESYWSYVGDNAATIILGIFAVWAPVLYIVRSKHSKE